MQGGFKKAVVTIAGVLYVGQSTASAGIIAQEIGTADKSCLDDSGALVTTATPRTILVRTKTLISQLAGNDTWKRIYVLAQLSSECQISLVIPDRYQYMTQFIFASTGGAEPPQL